MAYYYYLSANSTTTTAYYGNYYYASISTATSTSATGTDGYYVYYNPAPETEAQRAARLERDRVNRERAEAERMEAERRDNERELQRATAEQVAQRLIEDVFGKEKLDEYRTKKCLTLDSPSMADRRYVVAPSGMIKVYAGERLVDELCVHLVDKRQYGQQDRQWLPDADIVCGKAIRLLHDEEAFLAVAHHNPR